MPTPLFLDHAACCRSVLAQYLYEDLNPGTYALSAGIEAGDTVNDNALQMLKHWGIDASNHEPQQVNGSLCNQAEAIFAMSPEYLKKLFKSFGPALAKKSYLFADPFVLPQSLRKGEFLVCDPSFEHSAIPDLIKEFTWFRERVVQIHEALTGGERRLVSAADYMELLDL
jgi:protein-tyrosine-phosphatase